MAARVIMISGKIGSGKTTVSKLIARRLPAFRISHDEMLVKAYGNSLPTENFRLCCERINRMAWETVIALAVLGVSVVIEGWGSKALRDEARREAQHIGVPCTFVYVSCSVAERRRRVRARNHDLKGEGYPISDAEFERMEALDEEIEEGESFLPCANEASDREPDLAFLDIQMETSQPPSRIL